MLNVIDISNHQGSAGFKVSNVLNSIDGCICKATGGDYFVDKYCDVFIQTLRSAGKLWGFYHFAHDGKSTASARTEADFFINNCKNYFGEGIPVLDWEVDSCSVAWVNEFVRRVHDVTQVWPWIYANPWRFNMGGVEKNCSRWIAAYPYSGIMHLSSDPGNVPKTDGGVACWQFSSNGRVNGWNGALDLNHYYGTVESWHKYALGERQPASKPPAASSSILENDEYKVTIQKK